MDPRDQKWQNDSPVFRVYFWERLPTGAYRSDEREIREADVLEVLCWADEAKGDRTFTLYLCSEDDGGLGLILLTGSDPTAT